MKWIKNQWMNSTIRTKLILSYLLIALIPFLFFAVISTMVFTKRAEENVSTHTSQMLVQVRTAMEVYISSLEKLTNYISREVEEINFLEMDSEEDILWKYQGIKISDMLYNIANSHPEVAGILIATENDMYLSTGMTRISRDSFRQEEWYRRAIEHPEEIQIISNVTGRNIVTNESYSVDEVFSVSKALMNRETGKVMGVILMDIRHDIISQSIKSITIGEKGFIFVMDEEDQVVYTPVNDVTYRVNPEWLHENGEHTILAKLNQETYQIRCEDSDYTGWKIVGVFSQDEIMGSVRMMLYILMGFLILMTVCIVIFSLIISQTITNPIVRLKQAMKKAEHGDLAVRFNVDHQDEISELGRNFNHMLVRIEELIQMVYVEQQNKRTAEVKVLQEQIKPHFLYNTLDTIGWMARDHEAEDIVKVVDALTTMFRIGLNHGNDYITIKEEIKYVSNYLYIQKIRYQSKLNYVIDAEESIENFEVPKLLIQPLVENAIYHGIKTKRGEGHIHIAVYAGGDDYVEFLVEDDGAGMEQEQVEALNVALNQPSELVENQSFGVFYVKERLRLRYGDHFKVRVESSLGEGTRIYVRIQRAILEDLSKSVQEVEHE